jgi:hypothetical protein
VAPRVQGAPRIAARFRNDVCNSPVPLCELAVTQRKIWRVIFSFYMQIYVPSISLYTLQSLKKLIKTFRFVVIAISLLVDLFYVQTAFSPSPSIRVRHFALTQKSVKFIIIYF